MSNAAAGDGNDVMRERNALLNQFNEAMRSGNVETAALIRGRVEEIVADVKLEAEAIATAAAISRAGRALTTFNREATTLSKGLGIVTSVGKAMTTVASGIVTITGDLINASMGYVDQQVNLYDAQIKTIQQQNYMSQAIALNSAAMEMFGSNSAETRATMVGLNYQTALYNQAQKNQTVAATALGVAWLQTWGDIISTAGGMVESVVSPIVSVGALAAGAQYGASVEEGGLAKLHTGEEVVRASNVAKLEDLVTATGGREGGGHIFTQNNYINEASDAKAVADMINDKVKRQLASLSQRRGTY
jgi:hypothetical protein